MGIGYLRADQFLDHLTVIIKEFSLKKAQGKGENIRVCNLSEITSPTLKAYKIKQQPRNRA